MMSVWSWPRTVFIYQKPVKQFPEKPCMLSNYYPLSMLICNGMCKKLHLHCKFHGLQVALRSNALACAGTSHFGILFWVFIVENVLYIINSIKLFGCFTCFLKLWCSPLGIDVLYIYLFILFIYWVWKAEIQIEEEYQIHLLFYTQSH